MHRQFIRGLSARVCLSLARQDASAVKCDAAFMGAFTQGFADHFLHLGVPGVFMDEPGLTLAWQEGCVAASCLGTCSPGLALPLGCDVSGQMH